MFLFCCNFVRNQKMKFDINDREVVIPSILKGCLSLKRIHVVFNKEHKNLYLCNLACLLYTRTYSMRCTGRHTYHSPGGETFPPSTLRPGLALASARWPLWAG